jgi:hypothetical protein
MRSEAKTPIEARYLWFEGKVSPGSMALVSSGLPSTRSADTAILFVGFAYADLPFSKRFDVVFPKDRPHDGVRCESRVIAATQEFGKPFPEIPHGWKTICAVHFPRGIPQIVQQLPTVDTWYQNDAWVCVCDEATWECLKKAASEPGHPVTDSIEASRGPSR